MVQVETGGEIQKIIEIGWRRKWVIILPFMTIFVLVSLWALHKPNLYRSTSSIFIEPQKVPSDYVRSTVTTDIEGRLRSISQQMTSRTSASLEKASRFFQQAIETDPEFALAHVALAETYMLLGDYAELSLDEMLSKAEPAISRALSLDDQLAQAHAARAAIRGKAGDISTAIDAFHRALELDPNFPNAYHWYGDILLSRLQQPEAALPLLEEAYTLDPVSPALIVTIGQALEGVGRFAEAMGFYHKALEIEPAYASSYYLIGSMHATVFGRLDLGVRWSLEAAARDPRYVFNLRTATRYEDRNLAPGAPTQFGDIIDRQNPFRVRFGLRYRY